MIAKLDMFIALARERHFGRAAESLGVTQPTLSAAIRQLEEHLGVTLVTRGSRFGGLTPEGERTLIWAQKIVADARQMKDEMRALRKGIGGHLRLGVIPTALNWAARLVADCERRHPNLRFTVLSRTSAEILQMLQDLSLDAGLSYLDNEPLGRVSSTPLYRETYTLVCPPGHPLAAHAQLDWSMLSGLGETRLCLLTPNMQNRRIVTRHLLEAGIDPQAAVESNSTVILAHLVEQGGYASILPSHLARFLCRGPGFALVPLTGAGAGHAVGVITRYREPHPPQIQAVLDEAARMAGDPALHLD